MSAQEEIKRLTAPDIRARKGGEPIVALTSYHAHTARLVDRHCDVILVGDSLGMVMHGLETTVPVTLEMMISGYGHVRVRRALVVVDIARSAPMRSKGRPSPSARVLRKPIAGDQLEAAAAWPKQ
jgi:3-methyl-2-oxobutanoate hydroxymethyltransferase